MHEREASPGIKMSDVEQLVKNEPWRRGQGQAQDALDPTWSIERSARCQGAVKYHEGGWWSCECGYCGKHGYQHVHKPINHPHVYLVSSILGYLARRAKEGVSRELSIRQMLHIAGVAIRYASTKRSEELGDYVQQLIVR